MPRKLRLEIEGGLYHVINRGNYRSAVFASQGAKAAFEKALAEALGKYEEPKGGRVCGYADWRC